MKITLVFPPELEDCVAGLQEIARENMRSVDKEAMIIIRDFVRALGSEKISNKKPSEIPQGRKIDANTVSGGVSSVAADDVVVLPRAARFTAATMRGRKSTNYRGVSRYGKKWQARTTQDGVQIRLGVFAEAADAALCWDAYARKAGIEEHGLNFPNYVEPPLNTLPPLPTTEDTPESYTRRLIDSGYPAPRINGLVSAAFMPTSAGTPEQRKAVEADDLENGWED